MDDVHINIDNYNPKRNRKILIVFDNKIVAIKTNKKIQAIFNALFIKCRKLHNYLIMKIHNNRELQIIAINNSSDIDYTDFLKIYRKQ